METAVTSNSLRALWLAQDGLHREAEGLLPKTDVGGEDFLARGYLSLPRSPDAARDLLAKARRLLSGDLSHLAAVYEARAYEYLGQTSEGRILINAVLKEPLGREVMAQALLVKAVFDAERPMRALSVLSKIDMKGLRPSLKGRVHNQRARMYKELRSFDKALIEYAGAVSFFKAAGDTHGVAHALNNQAAVERKLRLFDKAHRSVDRAMALVAANDPFLAHFIDHKAQIFIDECRFVEAEGWANEAVRLVEDRENISCYIESACTLAQALAGQGKQQEGWRILHSVNAIAMGLDSNELLFKVRETQRTIAERFARSTEVELIELALKLCNGCVRGAAKKLDMTHTGIIKMMKRNNRYWKPKKPARLNLMPVSNSVKA